MAWITRLSRAVILLCLCSCIVAALGASERKRLSNGTYHTTPGRRTTNGTIAGVVGPPKTSYSERKNKTAEVSECSPEENLFLLEHPILLAPVSFVDMGIATTVTIPTGALDPLEAADERIAIIAPCFGVCMMQTYDGRCVRDEQCLQLTNTI